MMTLPLGKHFILEFCGCEDAAKLKDVNGIDKLMVQAAKAGNATVVSHHFHQFEPWGVSGVVVLEESHITVHTWPENNYAAIDVFYCDLINVDYAAIKQTLITGLRPSHIEEQEFDRGTNHHIRGVAA